MSEMELLACPFCGGPARASEPDMRSLHWQEVYVECAGDCGARGETFNFHAFDHEEPPEVALRWARERWNRRSPSTVVPGERK